MNELTKAMKVLNQDSPYNEIDKLKVKFAITAQEIEEVLMAEDQEQIDQDDADEMISDIIAECASDSAEIFDIEVEEDDDEEDETSNYSNNSNIVFFSESFASTLENLVDSEYQNPQEGVQAMMQATGQNEDTILDMITGDFVPDPQTGANLANAFPVLKDPTANLEWTNLVKTTYDAALEEQQDLENLEDYELETDNRISQMAANQENLIAAFNGIQDQDNLETELATLNYQTSLMVEQGSLTPYERDHLLGQISSPKQQAALFSQACSAMQVPIAVQLDRVKFHLDCVQKFHQQANFGEQTDGDSAFETLDLTDSEKAYAEELFISQVL